MTTLWVDLDVWKSLNDKKQHGESMNDVLRQLLELDKKVSKIQPISQSKPMTADNVEELPGFK